MTQRFDRSRLDEIAEAAPVRPVSFPTLAKIALLRQTMRQLWEGLSGRRKAGKQAAGPAPCRTTRP